MPSEDRGRAQEPRDTGHFSKLSKGNRQILPSSPQKEHSSANILTLGPEDSFYSLDLQNYKENELYYFKPLTLW